MTFTLTGQDLRLLDRAGYGPFEHNSEMLLQRELRVSENLDLSLTPEVKKLKFRPRFLKSRESDALLVLCGAIDKRTEQFLKFAFVGFCDVGNFGRFSIYKLTSIEARFLAGIDFAKSEFQLVEMHYDRAVAPKLIEEFNGFGSYEDVKATRRLNIFNKLLPTKLFLTDAWDACIFQFFTHTFISNDVSLEDSGFVSKGMECILFG